MSLSGMVEISRLQAKHVLAKCERSEHQPSFPLDGGRSGWGCSGAATFFAFTPSRTLPARGRECESKSASS